MGEKIDQFVENLRDKLNAVDDRMNNFKASIASAPAKAKADIQASLDKAKADHEARKHKVEETRKRINASLEAKKEETEAKIAEWKDQREVKSFKLRRKHETEKNLLYLIYNHFQPELDGRVNLCAGKVHCR